MNNKLMFSTNNDELSTPSDFYQKLNKIYNFTFDLAATKENTKNLNFFSKEDNSLLQDWHKIDGWLWCNPPYSKGSLKLFYKKAYEEVLKGAKIIMLVPARTDTIYFHKYAYKKFKIEFIKGRLKFGDNKNAAPFPSMIIKFESNYWDEYFTSIFEK